MIIIILQVFHTGFSWWFLTEVWVIPSLLKSLGLYSVFWPILIMLQVEWSPLFLWFANPSVPVTIFWWLYQVHQLQLVSPSLSCSIVFFQFSFNIEVFISLSVLFQFYPVISCHIKIHYSTRLFLTITRSGGLPYLRWSSCMSKSQKNVYVFFSIGRMLGSIYTIYLYSNFLYTSQ